MLEKTNFIDSNANKLCNFIIDTEKKLLSHQNNFKFGYGETFYFSFKKGKINECNSKDLVIKLKIMIDIKNGNRFPNYTFSTNLISLSQNGKDLIQKTIEKTNELYNELYKQAKRDEELGSLLVDFSNINIKI